MSADFVPKLSFTAREYSTILNELLDFIRATRPDTFSDFSESDLGVMLVQLAALVGDMLSFGQDQIASELFLATCRRYGSALRFAKSVGYVPRLAAAATVVVKATSLPVALVTDGGTVPKGSSIKGPNGLAYEVIADFVIAAGASALRVPLVQGTSYEEQFSSTAQQNQHVTVTNAGVQDGSWEVFVGDPTNSANKWLQVDNVDFDNGPTHTYDVFFDEQGRLIVRFGNGNSGLVPADLITVNYRTCDGASGNAPDSSIKGSVAVRLASPGVGTVSVDFLNHDDIATSSAGTQLHSGEADGTTVASATQAGTVGSVPVQNGTLILTFVLTGGGGTIQLTDTGLGTFTVTSNTTGLTLVTSAITYSTGAWSVQFSAPVAAGGSITADYFAIVPTGTEAATNVGAAVGGEDRETLEELRVNIPAFIRSQDKILTSQDYNDVLRKLAGIALSHVDNYVSSYTANLVKVNVWSSELVTFASESNAGNTQSQAAYTRYSQVSQGVINAVQNYLRARSLMTVHNVILRPEMLWCDVYLGTVSYDRRADAADIARAITAAVVGVFQSASGFVVRLSDLYESVRLATGVKYFNIERISTGTIGSANELQGTTAISPTVAGTLLHPVATPETVVITIEQTTTSSIVIKDDGAGGWIVVDGAVTIVSGSINYRTGAWTVTFGANLLPNQRVLASYANVTADYRRSQVVTLNGLSAGDAWPPPGVPTTAPITTPPYKDGLPLSALRAGSPTSPPYMVDDLLTYDRMQDIVVNISSTTVNLYDNTFFYNNEIYYDSVTGLTVDLRAINLRRLVFDLNPV